jgi:2-keto-4-pentenoate hydratase/2-oxohepta-3-ene-1,7-dioic acid hydratase in catechol pathway
MTVVRPSKIIGIGRNYRAHAQELGNEMPAQPIIFFKPPSAVIGPDDQIVLPPDSRQVEFEAEIGVVALERIRQMSAEEAERAPIGFVCVNDVTARDLQKVDGQWARAKGFDTFCPVGPRVVTGLDWRSLEVSCRLNGVERQRAKATDMAFSIPFLVSYISRILTLEPGDLIATGTPAGTAAMKSGDVVEVEVSGVGVLRNSVR